MKQFQTTYISAAQFGNVLEEWRDWQLGHEAGQAVMHLLNQDADIHHVYRACELIRKHMPDALYLGASAAGTLYQGNVSDSPLVVSCTIFERSDSFARVVQIPVENRDIRGLRETLSAMQDELGSVKAVQCIMTIDSLPIRDVCMTLEEMIPGEVELFGGGAFGDNLNEAYIFSKDEGICKSGVLLMLLGGPELHVTSDCVMGWKPLGTAMKVTRTQGKTVYDLDGRPAFGIYEHYLRIPKDENIFYNALEFPFMVEYRGRDLLRHALSSDEYGALEMSTDIPEGSTVHLTYGDPETIFRNVDECVAQMRKFGPEVIAIFDCFGRKTFWGDVQASKETQPFHRMAPTYGFCTAGEFLRTEGILDHHNLTLVVAGMREGGAVNTERHIRWKEASRSEATMSLVSRLANFINTATQEVVEANRTLSVMAVTDRLTGLYNRGEIQRLISERVTENAKDKPLTLVMIDLDDFKKVNDVYGHQEGDEVLRSVSALLAKSVGAEGAAAGRWGGEEFMLLLPGYDREEALKLAEEIRQSVEKLRFEKCGTKTASFGVAQMNTGENPDQLAVRVDEALYEAKHQGKNRVVSAK